MKFVMMPIPRMPVVEYAVDAANKIEPELITDWTKLRFDWIDLIDQAALFGPTSSSAKELKLITEIAEKWNLTFRVAAWRWNRENDGRNAND